MENGKKDEEMNPELAEEILDGVEESGSKFSYGGFPQREVDGRRSENRKVYDIKGLWSRHKEILQLDSMGYKGIEIAKMLGIHPVTVANTLNSTLGKEARLAIREERDDEYNELREEVLDLTRKSLDKYREILNGETEVTKQQLDVSNTVVLELSGLRAPTKTQSITGHFSLTPEEIEGFKKRGLAAAKVAGKLVEVEDEGGTK